MIAGGGAAGSWTVPVTAGDGRLNVYLGEVTVDPWTENKVHGWLFTAGNRHACTLAREGCGRLSGSYPDPAAHNRDVAYLRQWLEVLGFRSYPSAVKTTPSGRRSRAMS